VSESSSWLLLASPVAGYGSMDLKSMLNFSHVHIVSVANDLDVQAIAKVQARGHTVTQPQLHIYTTHGHELPFREGRHSA
jgi:hypothetical protein